jgi:methylmalonyl-CoA/ethylmalonyl-CoA epimerase
VTGGRIEALGGRTVGQVGIIVPHLEQALERYTNLWGLGPWAGYTYGPATVPELTYRGAPGRYSMRLALAGRSPQVELLQPLDGPSIYHEWLEAGGRGLHHVAVIVESLRAAIASMAGSGYDLLQSGYGYGLDGDGGYAYFDTERDFNVVIEAIEQPSRRREPDFVWPPP